MPKLPSPGANTYSSAEPGNNANCSRQPDAYYTTIEDRGKKRDERAHGKRCGELWERPCKCLPGGLPPILHGCIELRHARPSKECGPLSAISFVFDASVGTVPRRRRKDRRLKAARQYILLRRNVSLQRRTEETRLFRCAQLSGQREIIDIKLCHNRHAVTKWP